MRLQANWIIKYYFGTNGLKELHSFMTEAIDSGNRRMVQLIVADDLFSTKQNLDEVDIQDIRKLAEILVSAYESRILIIMSTNFEIQQIFDQISKNDSIGRISSRISEMVIANLEIIGPDHRQNADRNKNPFL